VSFSSAFLNSCAGMREEVKTRVTEVETLGKLRSSTKSPSRERVSRKPKGGLACGAQKERRVPGLLWNARVARVRQSHC